MSMEFGVESFLQVLGHFLTRRLPWPTFSHVERRYVPKTSTKLLVSYDYQDMLVHTTVHGFRVSFKVVVRLERSILFNLSNNQTAQQQFRLITRSLYITLIEMENMSIGSNFKPLHSICTLSIMYPFPYII